MVFKNLVIALLPYCLEEVPWEYCPKSVENGTMKRGGRLAPYGVEDVPRDSIRSSAKKCHFVPKYHDDHTFIEEMLNNFLLVPAIGALGWAHESFSTEIDPSK